MPCSSLPFEAVLFDLDGTLYDRNTVFLRWADDYLREFAGITDSKKHASALAQIASLDEDGTGSKKDQLEKTCRLYPPLTAPGTDFYAAFFDRIQLDEDAQLVLQVLEERAVPFGIVTNGPARQWSKLEQMGLRKRTCCLFVSETFGREKPDPEIFHAAARCLGFPPSSILFVGDHPAQDIIGAQRVGMRTAWLARGRRWPSTLVSTSHIVLDRLRDLLPLIYTEAMTSTQSFSDTL